MFGWVERYTHWLHTQWPAGHVEKLPVVGENGQTNVPGVYITGDLTGVPLLKFSIDTGVRTVLAIDEDSSFQSLRKKGGEEIVDLVIAGAGLSGFAAAIEAKNRGLTFALIEGNRPLSTIINFPKAKPIYTYPEEMTPPGDLQVSADVKEDLVEELEKQIEEHGIEPTSGHVEKVSRKGDFVQAELSEGDPILARRAIIAIGRSGNHRKLDVPGEDLDKVYNRLYDPNDFCGQEGLVVGGGDSALETAIALAQCGAKVTVSYRKKDFSRPKPQNIEKIEALTQNPKAAVAVEEPVSERVTTATGDFLGTSPEEGKVILAMGTEVKEITPDKVVLQIDEGREKSVSNDVVFAMIGREAPLDFFRRSGIRIHGEWTARNYLAMGAFLLFCVWMFLWKSGGNPISDFWVSHNWFPYSLESSLADARQNPKTLLGTIALSATQPSFYYGLAYCLVVTGFGIRRIKKRKTPYITKQTWTLILIQVIPLFLLPFIILPWLGHNGLLPTWLEDSLFPRADYDPHGREYWRSAGLILAWPLFIHNVFSSEPLWGWLAICFIQTFVLIPGIIYFWGKGAYCGWICSCGALAETLGDEHRTKMPHGPFWNRLNMAGQVILVFASFLLILRILGWMGVPGISGLFYWMSGNIYKYAVDITLSGILGVGLYFWFSGRVWCRFFCPLAALMHIYHRFSRFRILAEKKKCISCNVCTSVCHQGIDVMNFANKGIPMADPECVRCSACVQSCPTGVLSFGQVDQNKKVLKVDRTPASPVQIAESA